MPTTPIPGLPQASTCTVPLLRPPTCPEAAGRAARPRQPERRAVARGVVRRRPNASRRGGAPSQRTPFIAAPHDAAGRWWWR